MPVVILELPEAVKALLKKSDTDLESLGAAKKTAPNDYTKIQSIVDSYGFAKFRYDENKKKAFIKVTEATQWKTYIESLVHAITAAKELQSIIDVHDKVIRKKGEVTENYVPQFATSDGYLQDIVACQQFFTEKSPVYDFVQKLNEEHQRIQQALILKNKGDWNQFLDRAAQESEEQVKNAIEYERDCQVLSNYIKLCYKNKSLTAPSDIELLIYCLSKQTKLIDSEEQLIARQALGVLKELQSLLSDYKESNSAIEHIQTQLTQAINSKTEESSQDLKAWSEQLQLDKHSELALLVEQEAKSNNAEPQVALQVILQPILRDLEQDLNLNRVLLSIKSGHPWIDEYIRNECIKFVDEQTIKKNSNQLAQLILEMQAALKEAASKITQVHTQLEGLNKDAGPYVGVDTLREALKQAEQLMLDTEKSTANARAKWQEISLLHKYVRPQQQQEIGVAGEENSRVQADIEKQFEQIGQLKGKLAQFAQKQEDESEENLQQVEVQKNSIAGLLEDIDAQKLLITTILDEYNGRATTVKDGGMTKFVDHLNATAQKAQERLVALNERLIASQGLMQRYSQIAKNRQTLCDKEKLAPALGECSQMLFVAENSLGIANTLQQKLNDAIMVAYADAESEKDLINLWQQIESTWNLRKKNMYRALESIEFEMKPYSTTSTSNNDGMKEWWNKLLTAAHTAVSSPQAQIDEIKSQIQQIKEAVEAIKTRASKRQAMYDVYLLERLDDDYERALKNTNKELNELETLHQQLVDKETEAQTVIKEAKLAQQYIDKMGKYPDTITKAMAEGLKLVDNLKLQLSGSVNLSIDDYINLVGQLNKTIANIQSQASEINNSFKALDRQFTAYVSEAQKRNTILDNNILPVFQEQYNKKQSAYEKAHTELQLYVESVRDPLKLKEVIGRRDKLIAAQMLALQNIKSPYTLEEYTAHLDAAIKSCERILFLTGSDNTERKELQELRKLHELLISFSQNSTEKLTLKQYDAYERKKISIATNLFGEPFKQIDGKIQESIKQSLLELGAFDKKDGEFGEIKGLFDNPVEFSKQVDSEEQRYDESYDVLLRVIGESYGLTKQDFDKPTDKQRLININKIRAERPYPLIENVLNNVVTIITNLSTSSDMQLYRHIRDECKNKDLAEKFLICLGKDDHGESVDQLFTGRPLEELIQLMDIDNTLRQASISNSYWRNICTTLIDNLGDKNKIGALTMSDLAKLLIIVLVEPTLGDQRADLLISIEKAQLNNKNSASLAQALQKEIDSKQIELSIDAKKMILASELFKNQEAQTGLSKLQQQYSEDIRKLIAKELNLPSLSDGDIGSGLFQDGLSEASDDTIEKISDIFIKYPCKMLENCGSLLKKEQETRAAKAEIMALCENLTILTQEPGEWSKNKTDKAKSILQEIAHKAAKVEGYSGLAKDVSKGVQDIDNSVKNAQSGIMTKKIVLRIASVILTAITVGIIHALKPAWLKSAWAKNAADKDVHANVAIKETTTNVSNSLKRRV